MPKLFTPKVVTANDLLRGDVIYQTATGWSRDLADAEVLTDEADADLRLLDASCSKPARWSAPISPMLPLTADAPAPPTSARLSARRGPSNYPTASKRCRAMYNYTDFDTAFIAERNAQFRAQVERRIDGSLTEDEFKPLRLMNGLYLQLHAYMLRVAIPYGTLNSRQMRKLADIADKWDKGYGHFTTRQNIQYNWPGLRDVPDMLDALAEVQMHAIQTSGNTIRNVTADHFAGAAADEIADPRPVAELIRQWSTDHPEFQFLPRKFKVAVTGSPNDRAVTRAHDIGLRMVTRDGLPGFEVIVGGGLGRTPMIGKVLRDFLPREDLLPYLESIVSVYNLLGRRDNKYKARIKITVHENGLDDIRARVEERFALIRPQFTGVDQQMLAAIEADFAAPLLSGSTPLATLRPPTPTIRCFALGPTRT